MLMPDVLKTLHTKQLLKVLQSMRVNTWTLDERIGDMLGIDPKELTCEQINTYHLIVPSWLLGVPREERILSNVTCDDVRAELAKRPHVPNKQESKALRKAKALAGKNKGRRDR